MIPFIKLFKKAKSKNHDDKEEISGWQGLKLTMEL